MIKWRSVYFIILFKAYLLIINIKEICLTWFLTPTKKATPPSLLSWLQETSGTDLFLVRTFNLTSNTPVSIGRRPAKITRIGADPTWKAFWRMVRTWICHNHKAYYSYVLFSAIGLYSFWWHVCVGYYRRRNYHVSTICLSDWPPCFRRDLLSMPSKLRRSGTWSSQKMMMTMMKKKTSESPASHPRIISRTFCVWDIRAKLFKQLWSTLHIQHKVNLYVFIHFATQTNPPRRGASNYRGGHFKNTGTGMLASCACETLAWWQVLREDPIET